MTMHAPALRTRPVPACPVCGHASSVAEATASDLLYHVPGEWHFRRCAQAACRLVWLDPRPLDADLGLAYATYYTHRTPAGSPQNPLSRAMETIKTKALWLSRSRRTRQRMYLDDLPAGRLLDVGCGGGTTLRFLSRAGWTATGQEIDAAAADNARRLSGCEVRVGPLETLGLAAASFDAVTLSHVIEHAPSPAGLLGTCAQLLKPGGRLVAITPNIDSLGRHLYGEDWRGLEPPRHLQVFSGAALGACAEQAGLRVVRVFTTSAFAAYYAFASLQIRNSRLASEGRAFPWLEAMAFKIASSLLRTSSAGLGEELVLIATKGEPGARGDTAVGARRRRANGAP